MAGWKVTTAATTAAISTADAKAWLRVEHSADDDLIAMLVASATAHAENYLSQAFMEQEITETFDAWQPEIKLTIHPVISVDSIEYIDDNGDAQTLDSSVYLVDNYQKRCIITPAYSQSWPSARTQRNTITVTYTAGYETLPADAKLALLLMVADAYENRQDSVKQLPTASKYILDRINYTFLL